MSYFWQCISKYATFSGRARRAEYWYYTLFVGIFTFGFAFLDGILFANNEYMVAVAPLSNLFLLATFLPTLAVTVRRFHDTGRSGWVWFSLLAVQGLVLLFGIFSAAGAVGLSGISLSEPDAIGAVIASMGLSMLVVLAFSVVQLVFVCQDSQPGTNKYGPNPKEGAISPSSYGHSA